MPPPATPELPTVSQPRVEECERSARFWALELAPWADEMSALADRYAIVAAILSALSGLAVWPVIEGLPGLKGRIIVSVVALASSVSILIPKIRGYAECAKSAFSIGERYGDVLGALVDAREKFVAKDPNAPMLGRLAVEKFQEVRKAKEALKPYPRDLELKRKAIEESKQRGTTTMVAAA
jgi:hypothetical protein